MLNYSGLDGLNFYANILQIASYQELLEQANNNDILKELNRQNTEYLERLLNNQAEILKRLERIENVQFAKSNRDLQ